MRALTKPQWAMLIVTSVLALAVLMSACISEEDTSGTNTTVVAPTPTATPGSEAETGSMVKEAYFPCGPFQGHDGQHFREVLFWTGDGAGLVFSSAGTMWTVNEEGTELKSVLHALEGTTTLGALDFLYGFHADLSPDGTRLAYTSCQFSTEHEYERESYIQDGLDFTEREKYHYEIALSAADGSNQQRITHNRELDHYPVWSPDGSRLAFIRGERFAGGQLYTMSPDGSTVQVITPDLNGVALVPPAWSPDGKRLVFVVNEGVRYPEDMRSVYTVQSDGSGLAKVGEMGNVRIGGEPTAAPSWSPDSERVAFPRFDNKEAIINTVRFDGSDLVKVWSSGPDENSFSVWQVIWTPDGSGLLFVYPGDGVYAVRPDGGGMRLLLEVGTRTEVQMALSSDGSRLAAYERSPRSYRVMTIDMDGTNLRILAVQDSYDEPFRLARVQAP